MPRLGTIVGLARTVLIALSGLLWAAAATSQNASPAVHERAIAGEAFAVIVHPSTSATNMSLQQVRSIFLGEQQFWPGGDRVVLFVHAPGSVGREVALRQLYQMNEGEFKRYWIAKIFRDDLASGPKIVSSSALAKKLTASIPGAIAIIPASEVDETVHVLRIDHRLPGVEGYPLAAGPHGAPTGG
jgi:phosphate transport system substrate-binding protein